MSSMHQHQYMKPLAMPAPQQQKRELSMKFRVLKIVGKGSYGSVYQVQRLDDNQIYALKEMDLRSMNQAEREDAANEIRLMASIQHPQVVSYNEAFLDGNKLCIIMDYAPHGDLAGVIKNYSVVKRHVPEDLLWVYLIQICNGLLALHSMRVLHRDVKPGNVMLFANNVAKIGDLGIAKVLSKSSAAQTQIGTPHYMPPEIWKNQPYSYSSDSWAVGCLMYEMMTSRVPFEARNVNELRYKVLRGAYPRMPSVYSQELQQLVCACLDQDPERRPSMQDILGSQSVQSRMHLVPAPAEVLAPFVSSEAVMLDTIKVPRNIQMMKGKLPPAQYRTSTSGYADVDDRSNISSAARLPAISSSSHYPQQGYQQGRRQEQEAPLAPRESWDAAKRPRPRVHQAPHPQPSQPSAPTTPPAMASLPPVQQRHARGGPPPADAVKKASTIESVYKIYNQRPPPIVAAVPSRRAPDGGGREARQLRQQQAPEPELSPRHPSNISEAHAAYGAFYHSPLAEAAEAQANARAHDLAAQARARYDEVVAQHRLKGFYTPAAEPSPKYKGHYTPSEASGKQYHRPQPQQGEAHRGGGWNYHAQHKKPPIDDDDYF